MKDSFSLATLDVCGFYELDAAGTVLYLRRKHAGVFNSPEVSQIGLDFFEKVFVCQNSESLRRRFNGFVSARATTETFVFNCRISESSIPLRVMFVRVSETNSNERSVVFYIDVKPD